MIYYVKEKIGGPLIFEDVKMVVELDMVLNELHLHHLYQLLKLNLVMVSTTQYYFMSRYINHQIIDELMYEE